MEISRKELISKIKEHVPHVEDVKSAPVKGGRAYRIIHWWTIPAEADKDIKALHTWKMHFEKVFAEYSNLTFKIYRSPSSGRPDGQQPGEYNLNLKIIWLEPTSI